MNKTKLATILAASALTVGAVGCTTTNENGNARNTNANAVVTNNNGNANTSGVNTINGNGNMTPANSNISRADYDRDRARYDREGGTGPFSGTIGQGAADGWIHFKTRAALAAADDIRDSTINVDVDNNIVTLRGSVANNTQRARAETIARGIDDVTSVRNNLTVRSGDAPATNNSNR